MTNKRKVTTGVLAIVFAALFAMTLAACSEGAQESESVQMDASSLNADASASFREEGISSDSDNDIDSDQSSETVSGTTTCCVAYFEQDGEYRYGLVTIDGTTVPITIEGADPEYVELCGEFRDGLAFVEWYTYDYDESWKEATNIQAHLGCVDSSGKLALDLTDLIPDEMQSKLQSEGVLGKPVLYLFGATFSDGYALLVFDDADYGEADPDYTVTCIDTSGSVVWSKRLVLDKTADSEFEDGTAKIGDSVYDVQGNILCESIAAIGERAGDCQNAGYGYISTRYHGVLNYSGECVAGGEATEGSAIDARYRYAGLQLLESSPNGTGKTRYSAGVWSLEKGAWVVDPIPDATRMEICGPDLFFCHISDGSSDEVSYRFFNSNGDEYTLLSDFPSHDKDLDFSRRLDDNWYRFDSYLVHFSGTEMDELIMLDSDISVH